MKKRMALVLALVCLLCLVGCAGKSLTFDIGQASAIRIKSGLTGREVIIADDDFTRGITQNMNSLRFEKTSAVEGKLGYAYMLTWLDSQDEEMIRIFITDDNGYQISYEGDYYKVGADQNIDVGLIGEMLNIAYSSAPAPAP